MRQRVTAEAIASGNAGASALKTIRVHSKLMLAFGLYTYYYLTAELLFTDCAGAAFGEQAATVLYGVYCLAAAAGFFSFAVLRRVLVSTGARRRLLFGMGCVGVVFTAAAPHMGGVFMAALSVAAMLIAGHVGAAALFVMAVTVQEKSRLGMIIAMPYAGAFLLQYAMSYVLPLFGGASVWIHHVVIAAALAGAAALLLTYAGAAPMGDAPHIAKKADAKKYLRGALVACLIISCLYGLVDGIIMALHTGQQLNVYGWIRLIAIPGILFTGFMADYRDGRYFPFSTLAAWLAIIVAMFLFHTAETYNAALGSIYFFGSFMTMYSLAVFVRVAHDTDKPSFWASAGRGMKYAAGGVFALAGSSVFTRLNYIVITVVYVALLIALFMIFTFRGRLAADAESPLASPLASPFASARGGGLEPSPVFIVTEREHEIVMMLAGGKSVAAVADQLFISEKTVRNHISNMLRKTGAGSRELLFGMARDGHIVQKHR